MGKTSPLSGTDKKFKRNEQEYIKEQRKAALKDLKRDRHFNRETQRSLRAIQRGKGLPGYKEQSIQDLNKTLQEASKGAEAFYAPIRENAIRQFEQLSQPETRSNFGASSGQGSRSSALNQALASARGNLQSQLNADFSAFQTNLAQNLLNQREQSRQFGTQTGIQNLQAQLQASGMLKGQPINPYITGLAASPSYNPSGNRGPNGYQQFAGQVLQAGATIGGAMLAGPPGAVAGNQAASFANNKLGLTAQDVSMFGGR